MVGEARVCARTDSPALGVLQPDAQTSTNRRCDKIHFENTNSQRDLSYRAETVWRKTSEENRGGNG